MKLYESKCSDRSMEVELPALFLEIMYDRPTNTRALRIVTLTIRLFSLFTRDKEVYPIHEDLR